jgi:hypothetical protein
MQRKLSEIGRKYAGHLIKVHIQYYLDLVSLRAKEIKN